MGYDILSWRKKGGPLPPALRDGVSAAHMTHERLYKQEEISMDLIKALNKEQLEKEVPQVQVGDTVRVHVKVKEGARERIQVFEAPSLPRSTAVLRRPSPSAVSPTAWAWRRYSPFTPPPSPPSRWSVTASCAAPSCTTCATASVRLPRSRRSCKPYPPKKNERLLCAGVFSFAKGPGI